MPTRTGFAMIAAVGAVLMVAAAPAAGQVRDFTGHKFVRVRVDSAKDLERIKEAGGELLTCEPRPGTVDVHVGPGGMERLQQAGLSVKLLSADISDFMTRHLHRAAGAGPFDDYMPLADIQQFMYDLVAQRPDLCSVSTIGFSIENRPIQVLHITGPTGGNKPGVFYHGLQHCREWIGGAMVLYLANHLVTNYDTDPCIHDLVDGTNIYLVPCMNPDGYNYTWTTYRLWRKNRRYNGSGIYGVDLNRNWGVGWGGPGASSSPSDETYRGPSAFSEPETQAMRDFMIAHPEIRAHMDYHSYSELILWPNGYTSAEPPQPDRDVFYNVGYRMQELIQSVHGVYYEAGPIYSTIYPASGGSCDWSYGAEGIFGFSIELRPGPNDFSPGFELPPSEIIPTCEENLPAILNLTEFVTSDLMMESTSHALTQMSAGAAAPVSVHVTEYVGTTVPGSVTMHYRYAPGAAYTDVPMTSAGG
ncbi:MAG TPA: M14 family metallocarboxypeptidase, partial [Phycisphaerae bacterium]|nr:M14 family metallocarboxypeptidase [Phycisphaerae bacterium]